LADGGGESGVDNTDAPSWIGATASASLAYAVREGRSGARKVNSVTMVIAGERRDRLRRVMDMTRSVDGRMKGGGTLVVVTTVNEIWRPRFFIGRPS
jgi:hypothetical protein